MPNNAQNQRKEFASGDAMLSAFSQEVEHFKKLSYMSKQEATINYSGNNKATSYSMGKQDDTMKLEVYQSQLRIWEKMRKADTGVASVLGMKVVLGVTYSNDELEEVTDTITFIILSQGREVNGGTEGLAFELETLCLGIEFDT